MKVPNHKCEMCGEDEETIVLENTQIYWISHLEKCLGNILSKINSRLTKIEEVLEIKE